MYDWTAARWFNLRAGGVPSKSVADHRQSLYGSVDLVHNSLSIYVHRISQYITNGELLYQWRLQTICKPIM